MEEVRLWENNKKYDVLDNINQVVEAIIKGKLSMSFDLKDKFIPGDEITTLYDNNASRLNYILIYTNSTHPAIISEYQSFINPVFFKEHENEIKSAYVEYIKKSEEKTFSIHNTIFSDKLLDELLKIEDVSIYLYDIKLTDEQLKKIKEKEIDCYIKQDKELVQISSKYKFSFHTKKTLEEANNLYVFYNDLKTNDIKNLKYLKENSVINFKIHIEEETEEEKLLLLKEKLLELDSLNKKYIVKFKVEKRSIFNKIFKDVNFKNLDIVVENDFYDYPYSEYLKEEEKLNDLIKDIKDKDLSPLEKYIYVYNIVKNFKPYKENKEDGDQSRNLRYILDNEYMVCVGYSRLLVELLDKVGINANELSVEADISYDKGFTEEEIPVELAGHQRAIVSIDDDKYNIHGLYISDPTWDNNLDKNYLNHALLTIDSMQISKRMFQFNFYNPILDIHNFKEYNEQVNFLLKREIKENKELFPKYSFSKQLLMSYETLGTNILYTIKCDPKYYELFLLLKDCNTEDDYVNFYTKLGNYLLTRINIPVNEEILFRVNKQVIQEAYNINNSTMDKIDEFTRNNYYEKDIKQFPYLIPNDSDFNLEDKKTK